MLQHGDGQLRLRIGRQGKLLLLGLLMACVTPWLAAQQRQADGVGQLPDAPVPQELRIAGEAETLQGTLPAGPPWLPASCTAGACSTQNERMCCGRDVDQFELYLRAQAYHVLTTRQLAVLAMKNVSDPFNLLAVLGSAAIVVGSDSHSIYGPGMPGLARATGVTLTQDMTNEFFGTFLIPSLDHEAPGFRRMPNRPFWNRLAHCATQVVWTRSQTSMPMVNYSSLVGTLAEQAVSETYVPYESHGWDAAAERLGLTFATAPIGNLIGEFLPQVASHINIKVVFFQNIINRVATTVGQPRSM